jgi:hypothetical protein
MPSFLIYYKSISSRKIKGALLKQIADECGISYVTVTQRMTKLKKGYNTFTKLEKERIAQILNSSIQELFPTQTH